MGPHRKKESRSRTRGAAKDLQARFLAVHEDVQRAILEWEQTKHRPFARRVVGLMTAMAKRDENEINMLLRSMGVEKIHGSEKVFEIGPKQSKGGAPRVFFLREKGGDVFLAAGLEEGSTGADALQKATSRERNVLKILRALGSSREQALREQRYRIDSDPQQESS